MLIKMKPQLACLHRLNEAVQLAASRLNQLRWTPALPGLLLLFATAIQAQTPVLVKDIRPGALNSLPEYHTNANGVLIFNANDGVNGTELWKSDGTAAGTVLVNDLNPGAGHSTPEEITNIDGTVFFRANDGSNGFELWKSDGTTAGTTLVRDTNPGPSSGGAAGLVNVNGTLFFAADDGTNGVELWKTSVLSTTAFLVKDINPGPSDSNPGGINVNGTLFFVADDGTNGYELWKSDGTTAGTVLVKDINPGATASFPANLTNVNGTLFFTADDGTNGVELWKSDGTAAGTVLVKDINSGAGSSDPGNLTDVNGTLFFSADDITNGNELWKSDGSAAGTVLVKDIGLGDSGSFPFMLANVNGLLFFTADDGVNGYELWQSAGTAAGTFLIKDINPGADGSSINFPFALNGVLFFQADDGTNGIELWKSDGTAAGTVLVEDINPGGGSSEPHFFANVNGTLFFNADDGTTGIELWALLNTPAGSVVVVKPEDSATGETPVTLTFDNITAAGATTLNVSDTGPASPAGFSLGTPPTFYDISTSATFTGNIEVCIDYSGIAYADESALKLFHYESGAWVDVTTSLNTTTDVICGEVTSLSPFAIFEPVTGKAFVFLGNKVTLKQTKQTPPSGNIHSNGTLTIEKGTPSTYNSTLTAVGKITIQKDNTINGDVTSATSISNSGTINGTSSVGAVASEPLPSLSYGPVSGPNKTVPSGGTLALGPGSYGIVTINSGGTLELESGEYFMKELRALSSETVIAIDLTGGDEVVINVESNLQLGKEAAIQLLPNGEGDSELVTFNTLQSSAVSFGKEAYLLGSFNAPHAKVTLAKNSQLRGALCVKELLVERDCLFLHHDSPGTLPGPGNLPKAIAGEVEEVGSDQLAVTSYQLEQNYPNPFNPSTVISFQLPVNSDVTLSIFNLSGQLVRKLVEGRYESGKYEVVWDGKNNRGAPAATGLYVYVFRAGEFVAKRKLVLMK
jgi:ELWxxDGT repeat protein